MCLLPVVLCLLLVWFSVFCDFVVLCVRVFVVFVVLCLMFVSCLLVLSFCCCH